MIAEYPTARWLQNLRAQPEVQVRIAGAKFQARARVLSAENEPALLRAVQELSRKKYGWGDGVVVELREI